MRRDSLPEIPLDELVALAKTEDNEAIGAAKIDQRLLKDIELFIAEMEIKTGRKKVHSLILFDVYLEWQKTTTHEQLNRGDFVKGMLYFFPKHYDGQRNIVFKLSPKHKAGRFNLSNDHLLELRGLHGKKAKKEDIDTTVEDEISGTGSFSESS